MALTFEPSLPQPTKSRVRRLTLDGVDLTEYCNRLSIYETIKKPYFTGKFVIIDSRNIIENMGLKGEETLSYAFDGGDGKVFEGSMKVLAVHGNKSTQSLRSMKYDIHTIGQEFFNDKKNLVQQGFKNMPGTAAAQAIHGQYIGGALNCIAGSLGVLGQESYTCKSKHPFKAINEIRERLNPQGNWLYFKNQLGHQFGPLEAFMAQAGSDETFIQKATWGANWFDVIEAEHAIIMAVADVDDQKPGSAGAGAKASTKGGQSQNVFDMRTKKSVKKTRGGAGGRGGMPNYSLMDGANLPLSVDPSAKAIAENAFAAAVRDSPMMTVKVPIQTGINVTVGRGCYLKLIPPIGDLDEMSGYSSMSGRYMLSDLAHELFLDDRQMNATTTFQAYKVG